MSDLSCFSRSRSSLQGARTPLKLIQPPSSFIERVNKVTFTQIFENTKKHTEKSLESERYQSPYITHRTDRLSSTHSKHTSKAKPKNFSKKKLKLELFCLKIIKIFKAPKKESFDKIKKESSNKENEITRKHPVESDFKKMIEDTFKKYIPKIPQQTSTMTKCEKCGHVGLNFLTNSTSENFSPKFLDKVRLMLPQTAVKKSLGEVSTLPISDYYPEASMISPLRDNLRDTLCNYSPDFCRNSKIPVPKLNITEVFPRQAKPRYSEEVLKGSPIIKLNETNIDSAVLKLSHIFMTKVHHSFDMIFLSRATHQNLDHSLTFEFTLEESKISNEPSTLTGTFGDNHKLFEISSIQRKKDESFNFDYSENWNKEQNYKTACKILYTRLDKLFYRRKVSGFYSLVDLMYLL